MCKKRHDLARRSLGRKEGEEKSSDSAALFVMKRQERSPSPMPVVPRRPRSLLRTRAGDAWLEVAKRPRLGHPGSRPGRKYSSQAAPLDVESDRELDVAEALFDLANVAVSFGEQPDSDTRSAQHDSPYRHNEKIRRQQVNHRSTYSPEDSYPPRRLQPGPSHAIHRGHHRPSHKRPSQPLGRPSSRPSPYHLGSQTLSDGVPSEPAGPSQSVSVPKAVKAAARPAATVESQLAEPALPARGASLGAMQSGSIAAFFPGSNLPRGPYDAQGQPGMPESELQSNSGSTAAAAAAAAVAAAAAANGLVHSPTALMRPPIKHCAMHVYIAQFISDHMHHSRVKDEEQRHEHHSHPLLSHQSSHSAPHHSLGRNASLSQSAFAYPPPTHHQQYASSQELPRVDRRMSSSSSLPQGLPPNSQGATQQQPRKLPSTAAMVKTESGRMESSPQVHSHAHVHSHMPPHVHGHLQAAGLPHAYTSQPGQAGHLPPSLLAFPPPQNPQQNPMTQNSMAGNPMAAAAAAAHAAHFAAGNPNANSNANPHTHARIVSGALAALSPYQAQLQGLPLMHAPPAFPFLAQGTHMAGSPTVAFGGMPHSLSPQQLQQMASIAAMNNLTNMFSINQPGLPANLAGSFQPGSALPPHMAPSGVPPSMGGVPHSQVPHSLSMSGAPSLPAAQQHAKPEMQGEHSPAEPSGGNVAPPLIPGSAPANGLKRGPVGSAPPEASGPNPSSTKALPRTLAPDALLHLRQLGIPAGAFTASGQMTPPFAEQLLAAAAHTSTAEHADVRRNGVALMQ